MRKIQPVYIFVVGSVILCGTTTLYYFLVPEFNYFENELLIYKPGNALHELQSEKYPVSNRFLIMRFGKYQMMYFGICVLAYFIVSKADRLAIPAKYVRWHLFLSTLAFIFLIFINPYIIFPKQVSASLQHDIFISGRLDRKDYLIGNELILWYESISTPTSLLGICLCLLGLAVFAVGLTRGWNARSDKYP
jgi:hypothetical protein